MHLYLFSHIFDALNGTAELISQKTSPLCKHNLRTWHTGAYVAGLSPLDAGASVVAWRRVAGHVTALAVLPRVFLRTLALVASDLIDAQPAIPAG